MSIANYSVVGRILAEVQRSPHPAELVRVERTREPLRVFELQRTRRIREAPFATSFHFWAHALRAFLAGEGRPDLFEAMATHALCQVVEGVAVGPALAALSARGASPGLPESGPRPGREPVREREGASRAEYRVGYRMIDQDVMCSWVAEGDQEFVAVFWTRPDWLASAEPFDPEDDEVEAESGFEA